MGDDLGLVRVRVEAFYKEAGKACAGNLRCKKCGELQSCSPSDASFFLKHGWPVHCGAQMTLVSK